MARIRHLTLKNKLFNRLPERTWLKGSLKRQHIYSSRLRNHRDLDIYLPPSYFHDPHRRYPVLYVHDGNNLFYPQIAFGGMPWHMDNCINRLVSHGLMEEIIVVGIYNTPGRSYEYTWTPMRSPYGIEGGGGEAYANFLIEEVKPLIDCDYRTKPEAQYTGVMGSSLGGLVSCYLGLYYPYVFTRIGMVSPSLWWDHGHALKQAHKMHPGLRLWLDMGTREGNPRAPIARNGNIRNTRIMKQLLEREGYVEGFNLGYLEAKGGHHNEWHWEQRLHLILMFLYGTRPQIMVSR